jgi:hypothetical protein
MDKATFIELMSLRYDKLESLKNCDNFYDLEKGFVELWDSLGQEVLQSTVGKTGKDRRKKKSLNVDSGK